MACRQQEKEPVQIVRGCPFLVRSWRDFGALPAWRRQQDTFCFAENRQNCPDVAKK
jgi:hypothetical protein